MTDIEKRLRLPVAPEHHDPFKSGHWSRIHTQVLDAISAERIEAADEIERLREALAAIKLVAYDGETYDCYLIARKALEGK